MNKSFNIFLFLLFCPTLVLSIVVGFDATLPFLDASGASLANKEVYFLLLGLGVLIVNTLRSSRRWIAMHTVNQFSKYTWNTVVSRQRIRRVYTYNFLEALLMLLAGITVVWITDLAWLVSIALIIGALDAICFVVFGDKKNRFRTGITPKALIASDRDVIVIYFNGLRSISFQQQTLFFDFKDKELQFRLPIEFIPKEKRSAFFDTLTNSVNRTKVYFANNLPR